MHQAQAPWADFSFASCVHWQLRREYVCQQEPRCGCEERRGRGSPNRTSCTAYWTAGDTPSRWNGLNPEASNFYPTSVDRIFPTNFPKGTLGKGFIIM